MAQNDLTRKTINNLKRTSSMALLSVAAADILSGDTALVAVIPNGTVITRVIAVPGVGVNAGATIDMTVGGTAIVDELVVDAITDATVVLKHNTVDSDLVVAAGAVAPTTGEFEIWVEFAELTKKTGEYLN